MCTLAVFLQATARYPLIVAANRDEDLRRTSRAPFLWPGRHPIVAGRDERRGGTWLGVNAQGLMAGLTNLWTGEPADPRRRSRGEIVLGLLRRPDLEGAAAWLGRQDPAASNPFVAVCASATSRRGFWAHSADELRIHPLAVGLHVFGNHVEGPAARNLSASRGRFASAFAQRKSDEPAALLQTLQGALSHHDEEGRPEQGICVHTDRDYGTFSSSVLLLGPRLNEGALYHAPGPPCRTRFEDLSFLLRELSGSS